MEADAGGGAVDRELDFGGDAAGYEAWRRERDGVAARAAERWGLPIGRRVRLTLKQLDRDIEGRLLLAEPPPAAGPPRPLLLRAGGIEFRSDEILSCVVLTDNRPST